jgi:hypothetical protein
MDTSLCKISFRLLALEFFQTSIYNRSMQKIDVEPQLSLEEVQFDTVYSRIKRKLEKPGAPHSVRLATDQDGLMHLEIGSTGSWNIKIEGEDGYEEYGKVDLPTAEQLLAYIVSPEFRRIETSTSPGVSYMEEKDAHMAENGLSYQKRLFGAMDAALERLS